VGSRSAPIRTPTSGVFASDFSYLLQFWPGSGFSADSQVAKDGDQIALTTRLYPQCAEPVLFIVEGDALYQANQDLGRRPCAG
jgi:hypothetical protein